MYPKAVTMKDGVKSTSNANYLIIFRFYQGGADCILFGGDSHNTGGAMFKTIRSNIIH